MHLNVTGSGLLTLDARREESSDGRSVSRAFSRTFAFPASCELDKVESSFSERSGLLTVTAPKRRPAKREGEEREVRIRVDREKK